MSELMSQRLPLIGRREEKARIARAIRGEGPSILFVEGIAGQGKTFLLEEADQIARDARALCPPIVDFYDTEMHAHPALEAAIALNLDPEKAVFREYWARRAEMERAPLPERKTLKEQQEALWNAFLQGYSHLADQQRVVLRFDTAEHLEYERDSDEVQVDCEVSPQDAPSWEWLLGRIGALPNTATLIAARPTASGLLRDRLLDVHKGQVDHLTVRGFNLEETEAYFRATDFGKQVAGEAPEMVQKIHLLSDGRPILIALALDWLARGRWDSLYSVKLGELQARRSEAQAEKQSGRQGEAWHKWEEIKRNFEVVLVQKIRDLNYTGLDIAVKYAALARKGYNADLLARLMSVPLAEAEMLVTQLQTLSFVKTPRGPRQLFFLHDEMYDLVEKYIWLVDWPDYSEQARLDGVIIAWYTEQIDDFSKRMRHEPDLRKRSQLRRQQQVLYTERLYYQFDQDPRLGYQEYTHLDEEAIASRELEWDHLLRNEGLWFTRTRGGRLVERGPTVKRDGKIIRNPTIDYDCRRRWVWRYIAQNELQKAVRVAEKLLAKPQDDPDEPELWRGGVHVALATTLAYQGGAHTETALRHFREGIQKLEAVPQDHKEAWLYPYFLGTAYLYQGLALRNWLRLKEAARNYSVAVSSFESIGHKPRQAEALNNLAYINARQGKLVESMDNCERALGIRRELADEYNEGLSRNTMGIIYERMNQPPDAIRYSLRALEMFREIGSERGIILAEINLGRSFRRKGRSLEWSQGDQDFQTGIGYLIHAIDLQKAQGANADIFYKIEAQNELGCLYRDWVATLCEQGRLTLELAREYLNLAEDHLLAAISLASEEKPAPVQSLIQYADCVEDLARVYFWRGQLNLPMGQYGQRQGRGIGAYEVERALLDGIFKEVGKDTQGRWEEIDLILGKAYVQYARLERETGKPKDAAAYYARAAGLLERYSWDAPELHKAVSDVSAWLMTLPSERVQELVETMAVVLLKEELDSVRLRERINTVVYPLKRVHWPRADREMLHG